MASRIEVFYAYAPQDETWVQELEKHLSLLQRQGIISTWHPRLIAAGSDRERRLGPEHPETARILHDLAYLYTSQGRYAEAEPLYLQALAIQEKQLGSEHPDTALSLQDLADLYAIQGKDVEAEPLYQRALAIRVQQLGPEHPDTQFTQERYASFLRQKRNP